jgi:hypothetical protein
LGDEAEKSKRREKARAKHRAGERAEGTSVG